VAEAYGGGFVIKSGAMKRAIPFAFLFFAIYALVWLGQWVGRGKEPGSPTTYGTGTAGYKVLYLWLEHLGIPVTRWERDLKAIPEEASVVAILEPELGPDPGELGALEGWVRRGGTLFLASRFPNPFLKHFDVDLELSKPEAGEDELGIQPGPYIRSRIAIRTERHLTFSSRRPEMVVHAGDKWGALVGVVEEGRGRVIVLSDPALFSNLKLREADHGRLALDLLLSHLGKGNLLVDEYHHGYGRATSVIGHVLSSRVLGLFFQGGIILLILWAAAGRRFGSPRPLPSEVPRSSLEYVRAMANLFQRAKASRLALETVSRWIEDEARRLLIDKDPGLREKLRRAKERYQIEGVADRDLLLHARDLYEAFERARKKAPGG
jgi:hypothetical protein